MPRKEAGEIPKPLMSYDANGKKTKAEISGFQVFCDDKQRSDEEANP